MTQRLRTIVFFLTKRELQSGTNASIFHSVVLQMNPLISEWFSASVSSQILAWNTTARREKCVSLMRPTPPCVYARTPPAAPLLMESLSMWVWFFYSTSKSIISKFTLSAQSGSWGRAHLNRLSTYFSSGLRHRQQDLRYLLPLLCHQVHPGGNQEGSQAAPWLCWTLQMWALTPI